MKGNAEGFEGHCKQRWQYLTIKAVECDDIVVRYSGKVNGVAQEPRYKVLSRDDGQKEELDQVYKHEEGKEGVAVQIKAVRPLDTLIVCIHALDPEKGICHKPSRLR